jgi:quercetin dioxygenase-like cupin family protein
MTLAVLAERSGLNIGYLSQIENDKASPSLDSLAVIADALDVPPAWLLIAEVPRPKVVRAGERSVRELPDGGRAEVVDGGLTRGFAMLLVSVPAGSQIASHSHRGEEHHLILRGRWRVRQGEHELELGPGDYVAWDGTIPHDFELVGDEDGEILVVARRADGAA